MLKLKYRDIVCSVAPPKCLFYIATQIEQDQYILIEQSAHLVMLKFDINLLTPYTYITS